MSRTNYSDETKAAVMASLLAGQSVGEVARQYSVPAATVRSWKSRQANGEGVATVATEKKEQVGEMLVGYLQEVLLTLQQQAVFFRSKDWLQKQDASSAAVLHGVLADKATRLLEALGRTDGDDAAGN